jgi:hypothetical protein
MATGMLSPMFRASRWTAGFLLLVMLVPAFGPLAMAQAEPSQGMHCMRPPVSIHAAEPAMPCHHAMARSKPPQSESSPVESSQVESSQVESSQVESSQASFQASDDNCCLNHCCCGAATSEWAQPTSTLLSFLSLTIEPAHPAQSAVPRSSYISGQDSARAPPRS